MERLVKTGRLVLLADGDKIQAKRLKSGLSERDLASLAGICRETLRSMEASNHVQRSSILAVAQALNVNPFSLATEEGGLSEIAGAT